MKMKAGDICSPTGFLASGVYAGIRKNKNKLDLAIIYSEIPAVAAGVFTINSVKAAPVLVTKSHLQQQGKLQAIVINSGNANACTGEIGMQHALEMAYSTAKALAIDASLVGVASTGVMGLTLPIDNIKEGIFAASQTLTHSGELAAQAILTTDTFSKTIALDLDIAGHSICIGGIAKGSGMIHPNMATMLGFITSDVAISQTALQAALSYVNQKSFNMVTVDGDCSTNDMVLALANGYANNPPIESTEDPNWLIFCEGLLAVCTHLAKKIAQDGEGATKLIEVQVSGASNTEQAQLAARAVCRSPLVKTAVFGRDANWGRIASALGASGALLNPKQMSILLGSLPLYQNGAPMPFSETKARKLLNQNTIIVKVNLGCGAADATAWGCDLTYDYIKINASYRN